MAGRAAFCCWDGWWEGVGPPMAASGMGCWQVLFLVRRFVHHLFSGRFRQREGDGMGAGSGHSPFIIFYLGAANVGDGAMRLAAL